MTPLCDCSALAVVAVVAFAIGRAVGRRAGLAPSPPPSEGQRLMDERMQAAATRLQAMASAAGVVRMDQRVRAEPTATPTARRSSGDQDLDALFAQAEREGAVGAAWVVVEDDGVLITFRRFAPMHSAAMPAEVGEEVGRAVAEAVAEAQTPGGRVLSD